MAEREDRKQITARPVQPSHKTLGAGFNHVPGEPGPRHTMHRQSLLIEMKKRRRSIELDSPAGSSILESRQTIRPRMKQWDTGGAPLLSSDSQIVHAPQNLLAVVTERSAEHATAG